MDVIRSNPKVMNIISNITHNHRRQGSLYNGNDLPHCANSEEGYSIVTETFVFFSVWLSWIEDTLMFTDMDQLRSSL